MPRERDPRVVKVAEKLAAAQPYGFEYVKSGPSAADYHAAIIAVKTLDEEAEYEYAIATDEWVAQWGSLDECQTELDRIHNPEVWGALPVRHKLKYKIVKRRKAGEIEDV